jgi:hypothetical protein
MNLESHTLQISNKASNEMFVHQANVYKGAKYFSVPINKVILKSDEKAFVVDLKQKHNTESVYLLKTVK